MKYVKQIAGCISWCTWWARKPHAEKLLSATLHTLISQKSEKSYAQILHFCVSASLLQFEAQ